MRKVWDVKTSRPIQRLGSLSRTAQLSAGRPRTKDRPAWKTTPSSIANARTASSPWTRESLGEGAGGLRERGVRTVAEVAPSREWAGREGPRAGGPLPYDAESLHQTPRAGEGKPYSSQSRSFSFFGMYSSVMKLMPRRERASSSNLTPLRTISWISRCQCAFLNQG